MGCENGCLMDKLVYGLWLLEYWWMFGLLGLCLGVWFFVCVDFFYFCKLGLGCLLVDVVFYV